MTPANMDARATYQQAAEYHSEAVLDALLAGDLDLAEEHAKWSNLCRAEAEDTLAPLERRLRYYVGGELPIPTFPGRDE